MTTPIAGASPVALADLDAAAMIAIDGGGGWRDGLIGIGVSVLRQLADCLADNPDRVIEGIRRGWAYGSM